MNSLFVRLAMSGALLTSAVSAEPIMASNPSTPMSVAEFLGKVDGLKAKGPLALFSPDFGRLNREGKSAMQSYYAQATPGAPSRACPPPHEDLKLKDSEFLGFLQAVPPPQRPTTSVAQAVAVGMNKRFPCR